MPNNYATDPAYGSQPLEELTRAETQPLDVPDHFSEDFDDGHETVDIGPPHSPVCGFPEGGLAAENCPRCTWDQLTEVR